MNFFSHARCGMAAKKKEHTADAPVQSPPTKRMRGRGRAARFSRRNAPFSLLTRADAELLVTLVSELYTKFSLFVVTLDSFSVRAIKCTILCKFCGAARRIIH